MTLPATTCRSSTSNYFQSETQLCASSLIQAFHPEPGVATVGVGRFQGSRQLFLGPNRRHKNRRTRSATTISATTDKNQTAISGRLMKNAITESNYRAGPEPISVTAIFA